MIQNQTMPMKHSTGDSTVDMTHAALATVLKKSLVCQSELLLSDFNF